MGRVIGLLVVFALGLFAAFTLRGPDSPDLECPDPPVLAAGPHMVALSCVDSLSYQGTTYYVGCADIHPSRLAERFLEHGGDTYFTGARDIQGIPRSEAFALEGEPCGGKAAYAAAGDGLTRSQMKLIASPIVKGTHPIGRLSLTDIRRAATADGRVDREEAIRLAKGVSRQRVRRVEAHLVGRSWEVSLFFFDGCQRFAAIDAVTGESSGGGGGCP